MMLDSYSEPCKSPLACARCETPITPGERRRPTENGTVHQKCEDRDGVEHLRLANQRLAETITNQHDLTEEQIWGRIEDARTALRNAGRELHDVPKFEFCRSCGRPGRDYRG